MALPIWRSVDQHGDESGYQIAHMDRSTYGDAVVLDFGKYKGKALGSGQVPVDYLEWMLTQAFVPASLKDKIADHLNGWDFVFADKLSDAAVTERIKVIAGWPTG